MSDIVNTLNNINILYNRKELIRQLIETIKQSDNIKRNAQFDKIIIKSFDIQLNDKKELQLIFKDIGEGKYNTIENNGGGDCFFYSVIDSDVDLIHNNINLRIKNNGDIKKIVKEMRGIAISKVKEYFRYNPAFIPENYSDNISKLYEEMSESKYWADDFMINAICDIFDITPIMIDSESRQIYCGVLQREKYGDNNSLDLLQNIKSKFILIYYHTNIHFEAIYVKDESSNEYIKNFEGYYGFEFYNKEIMDSIIKKCNFS